LRDYQDLEGESVFDKVTSVGMFEHVGLKNLAVYYSTVHRLLKPQGLFLNHGITHDVEGWSKTSSTEFINRYVFPDGQAVGAVGNTGNTSEPHLHIHAQQRGTATELFSGNPLPVRFDRQFLVRNDRFIAP